MYLPSNLRAQVLAAEEVVSRGYKVFFYPGNDMRAKLRMRLVSKEGSERLREMTMLRKNGPEGAQQRFFIYFYNPADVRDMTFMVWKHPPRDAERWLFLPALNLVRRIAANDRRSSFVGSDFSYEDVSGREVQEDAHTLLREEALNGRPVFVIRSVPKDAKSADFSYKLAWIDKESFVIWREEYYDKREQLYKVFTADEVKPVQGLWSTVKRTMKNVQNGHWTEVTFQEIEYNVGLEESLFSERYLRNPPARWIR
jgi:outer membrane lipoprotein-sorting protein